MKFQEPSTKFPVPYRSRQRLTCGDFLELVGGSEVVCAGGSDYTYTESPRCHRGQLKSVYSEIWGGVCAWPGLAHKVKVNFKKAEQVIFIILTSIFS